MLCTYHCIGRVLSCVLDVLPYLASGIALGEWVYRVSRAMALVGVLG